MKLLKRPAISFLFTIFLNSRSLNSIFKSRHDLGLFEGPGLTIGLSHEFLGNPILVSLVEAVELMHELYELDNKHANFLEY
ncbi:unnamed protein product [Rhizophagus irregularis]|nr:unnamed protein product [Rhizophagus irregularis]